MELLFFTRRREVSMIDALFTPAAKRLTLVFIGATAAVIICLVSADAGTSKTTTLVSPSPPTPSPAIVAKAKEWFFRFQSGNIDRSQLNDRVNLELTTDMIEREKHTLQNFGTPKKFNFLRRRKVSGTNAYDFLLTFPSGTILEAIAFDQSGKIAGIDFQPFGQ